MHKNMYRVLFLFKKTGFIQFVCRDLGDGGGFFFLFVKLGCDRPEGGA